MSVRICSCSPSFLVVVGSLAVFSVHRCVLLTAMVVTEAVAAPQRNPTFEVSSIKPNADSVLTLSGITAMSSGRLSARAITLKALIVSAYRVRWPEVSGGPAWLDSMRFDVEARAGTEAAETELRLMLQTLLAERFRLRLHREMREAAVYTLVVAGGGPRVKLSTGNCEAGPGLITLVGRIVGKCGTSAQLAESLSRVMDRPVVDRTALTGAFPEMKLDWVPDETQFSEWGRGVYTKPVSDPSGPSLFTAVQEYLGLRLEASRAPIEMVVVDTAELPAPN